MNSTDPYATYEPVDRLLLTPEDPAGPRRAARLAQLGIGNAPLPEFDEFARRLATELDAPYAMVNFIDHRRQFFAGLYTPEAGPVNVEQRSVQEQAPVGREMGLDHGFCPHTVKRTAALVLDDVCDYPRFAGNPVVDEIGIRSYMGAPLHDVLGGMNLGTICVVDTEARPWGRQRLEIIKSMAQEMADWIQARAQGNGT